MTWTTCDFAYYVDSSNDLDNIGTTSDDLSKASDNHTLGLNPTSSTACPGWLGLSITMLNTALAVPHHTRHLHCPHASFTSTRDSTMLS